MKRQPRDDFTLLCESCGYVIEGLAHDARCPECGTPIAESLPGRREGTPWQRHRSLGSFFATIALTIANPGRTLASLRPESPRETRFGNRVIMLAAYTASLAAVCTVWAMVSGVLGFDYIAAAAFQPPVLTVAVTGPILFFLTATEQAGLLTISRVRGFRLTPGYARAICGHGTVGWLIAAVLGGGFAVLAALAYEDNWSSIVFRQWINWPLVFTILAALGTLGGFLFFEVFAWLGLRRLKYANTPPR